MNSLQYVNFIYLIFGLKLRNVIVNVNAKINIFYIVLHQESFGVLFEIYTIYIYNINDFRFVTISIGCGVFSYKFCFFLLLHIRINAYGVFCVCVYFQKKLKFIKNHAVSSLIELILNNFLIVSHLPITNQFL